MVEIKKKIEQEQIVGHICDICGADCRIQISTCGDTNDVYATLSAHWPYGSKYDTTEHECHMCEKCYDKVRSIIIHQLGGAVHIRQYDLL